MDSTLKYKGFIGSIEIDFDDYTFYGKVQGLDKKTLIIYEGKDVLELKQDFENAIDDYIDYCKENNLPVHKSYSGNFNVRIPSELHAKVSEAAMNKGMTLNAFVKQSLESAVCQ